MNVVDLPALRHAAATVLAWADHPPPTSDPPEWGALAEAIHTLRAASHHGRLAHIIDALTSPTTSARTDDALRDLADLTALPRPHRVERTHQLELPLSR